MKKKKYWHVTVKMSDDTFFEFPHGSYTDKADLWFIFLFEAKTVLGANKVRRVTVKRISEEKYEEWMQKTSYEDRSIRGYQRALQQLSANP